LLITFFACIFCNFPNRSEISIKFCGFGTNYNFFQKYFFWVLLELLGNFGAKLAPFGAKNQKMFFYKQVLKFYSANPRNIELLTLLHPTRHAQVETAKGVTVRDVD